MRRLLRARCSLFGHAWTRWSDWKSVARNELEHERACTRCPAVEVQRDGEEGVIHV